MRSVAGSVRGTATVTGSSPHPPSSATRPATSNATGRRTGRVRVRGGRPGR
jgi:hypothetical protein